MAVHLFHLLIKQNDDILKSFDTSKRNMDTLNLTKLMVDGDLLEQDIAFETGKYLLRFDERLKMFDIFSHPAALERLVRSESLDVWAKLRDLDKAIERN